MPTVGYNKIRRTMRRAHCSRHRAARSDPFLAIKLVVSAIDQQLAAYQHRPL